MALDKAIASGKEYRRPYRGSKSFDSSCRNHGKCSYCANGRQHRNEKRKLSASFGIDEAPDLVKIRPQFIAE